jgi:Fe-S cluster assembly iron-binding protein IscA
MKAGFSKKNITPRVGITMGGHPGIKYAQKIRDDLYVRAMALNIGECNLVFLSADVLFVEYESVEFVKHEVCKKVKLNPDHIFICSTHTHSGL